ncbi:hypothetical protein KKJ06_16610 [Xenorhabdus bovienii]|uniref:hypothetical protein n=1 Tax=Xenorhabdus bovienii TaxID=40576 RepID=UPI0023B20C2C|nr:hypothetical protein [Xenorhabdus bovienii]MDE9557002.1 hypothetical protein [Xenorhabdus bovienii]
MSIIFKYGENPHFTPNTKTSFLLLRSKGNQLKGADIQHLVWKVRRCYPRGMAYKRLEELELSKVSQ